MTEELLDQSQVPLACTWPVPPELPLYAPIKRAAQIAGVSSDTMRQWVDAVGDHVPYIKIGNKKLVSIAALPDFMARKEY